MHWLAYLLLHSFSQSIKDSIRKHSLNFYDNLAVLSAEFTVSLLIFVVVALLLRVELVLNQYTMIFLGLGVVQGMGTIGKINAMNISLSKTMIASKFGVIVPIVLAMLFLGEWSLFSPTTSPGILRILALVIMPFAFYFMRKSPSHHKQSMSVLWIISMLQMFLFHGALNFLVKLFINIDLVVQAALFQRISLLLTVLLAAFITNTKFKLDKRLLSISSLNGLLISIAHFSSYAAVARAPLVVIILVKKPLIITISTLAGLFIYGEKKDIDKVTRWGYILSILGGVILLLAEIMEKI